jgi:hypothetical protein
MLKFTYTKPNGDISERVGLVVRKPTDNYSMLDITDLDESERAAVVENYRIYLEEEKQLRDDLLLNSFWKNFKSERMTDFSELK